MIQCSACPSPGRCRDFGCVRAAREAREADSRRLLAAVLRELNEKK